MQALVVPAILRVLRCVYADRIDTENALLVIHPDHTRASKLVPLIEHHGKHGFLVVDMADVDDFTRSPRRGY